MKVFHVDVFSKTLFQGNGLTVVFPEKKLTQNEMQNIATEFKQFETIFLWNEDDCNSTTHIREKFNARIFTVTEELDFAGHPVLGGVAVIHKRFFPNKNEVDIVLKLPKKEVKVSSMHFGEYFQVVMNQGIPSWGAIITRAWQEKYCYALNLCIDDLSIKYPMQIVSTGLPYLIVPVVHGLEKVKMSCDNFEALLAENGAKFVYVFDINKFEARTWDNLGLVEDVATGSAAGPMGAYVLKNNININNKMVSDFGTIKCPIEIHQGSFVGRPSILKVFMERELGEIYVAGDVVPVMEGDINV